MPLDAVARLNAALAGHYEIDREVGRGGMASVFLAQDVKHARRVAIKVLHPELAAAAHALFGDLRGSVSVLSLQHRVDSRPVAHAMSAGRGIANDRTRQLSPVAT